MNKNITRQDAIKEMSVENGYRPKVWRKASDKPIRFLSLEHQRRYEITMLLEQMLNTMTDREFEDLKKRVELNEQAKDAQGNLFK
ncbi:hypothetical protein [Flavilitoribacter nigricans]|uniref:Uncharacterized protein n=1 Tax=Flavilitoribacter nigricans (strain ATCC 23147 / DSM 23189 / NBRC 102662 / NCIMB 1420 / SS-2) TaxID=1122177 RepID=A0A2D0MXP0_FLAN2|nr:hypothetical protein [Flavilitoribacter nigricans]PHN00669.1 hypothetical protein CRP01_41140 [Flavilitoribacter nigricans DSM 23189 = NBRC 102662]